MGGGNHPAGSDNPTAVELLVDGNVVRSATGRDGEALNWASWDVKDLAGTKAQIKIVDDNSGGWGHLNVDHIMFSDTQAQPVSQETSVNLIVDGQVVRSATGSNSETLDWASFDMRPYAGKQARIQIADMNTAGWGHLLADQFTAADTPAKSVVQRADWADYGKDYYAAVSWEDAPDGKRYMIGWMNNWDFARRDPHVTLARRAEHPPRDGPAYGRRPHPADQPAREQRDVPAAGTPGDRRRCHRRQHLSDPDRSRGPGRGPRHRGGLLPQGRSRLGLKVRTGAGGEETVIGYDTTTQELYVDRTHSGARLRRRPSPPSRRALKAKNGKVKLRILVDWSSVEVFGGSGGRHHRPDLPRPRQPGSAVLHQRLGEAGPGPRLAPRLYRD